MDANTPWQWAQDSQFWANAATAAVIVVAVVTFAIERRRIEKSREEQAFETVTTHYLEFLRLAMENPDLTLAELDTEKLKELPDLERSERDARRDRILFEYFFQVIEKVFVLYRAADLFRGPGGGWNANLMRERLCDSEWRSRQLAASSNFRTSQWLGWDEWLASYAESPRVLSMWTELENDSTYDTQFMAYMDFRLGASTPPSGT